LETLEWFTREILRIFEYSDETFEAMVVSGDTDTLGWLLRHNHRDADRELTLFSTKNASWKAIEYLADIFLRFNDISNNDIISSLAANHSFTFIERLLKKGFSLNSELMNIAVQTRNSKFLEFLIEKGVTLN